MPRSSRPNVLDVAAVAPSEAERLIVSDEPDIAFDGFGRESFAILERLRAHPHIEQYRKEKPGIRAHLKDPFKTYRDDLVVNLVLPNRLDLETERNVFSRLLKNDFGAGGCHHHYWLSFYRPHRTRLTDVQLAHSIWPTGLRIAVFAGKQTRDVFKESRRRLLREPQRFLGLINPLLETGDYTFSYDGGSDRRVRTSTPVTALPDDLPSSDGFAVYRTFPMDDVVQMAGAILRPVLHCAAELWPFYRFLLT